MTYRRSHVQVGTDENPHESNESSVAFCPVHMSTGPPASETANGTIWCLFFNVESSADGVSTPRIRMPQV